MRLRVPPLTGNASLDQWLSDVYQGAILQVGFVTPCWAQANVAAAQTNVSLNLLGTTDNQEIVMPYPGDVVGIAVASNAARTAGTLTVRPVVSGTGSNLVTAALDATNTTYGFGTLEHSRLSFAPRDRLGVQITTSGAWAPVTADIVVNLFILF